jgi:hypothetical protein
MIRPKSICKHYGCNLLIDAPGYCPKHQKQAAVDRRVKFDELRKDNKEFYQSARWHAASLRHRHVEPLCRGCKASGQIVPATLVHHDPDASVLIARGDDPYDDQWLVSLCNKCHLKHLRCKK